MRHLYLDDLKLFAKDDQHYNSEMKILIWSSVVINEFKSLFTGKILEIVLHRNSSININELDPGKS